MLIEIGISYANWKKCCSTDFFLWCMYVWNISSMCTLHMKPRNTSSYVTSYNLWNCILKAIFINKKKSIDIYFLIKHKSAYYLDILAHPLTPVHTGPCTPVTRAHLCVTFVTFTSFVTYVTCWRQSLKKMTEEEERRRRKKKKKEGKSRS